MISPTGRRAQNQKFKIRDFVDQKFKIRDFVVKCPFDLKAIFETFRREEGGGYTALNDPIREIRAHSAPDETRGAGKHLARSDTFR